MNKMIVSVFGSESAAAQGLAALKELHRDGEITLYGTAVLSKDAAGKVSVKDADDDGPMGSAVGLLAGGLLGLLGGPVGLAIGASAGGLTGLVYDLNKSGVDVQFVDDVAKLLQPGKVAVVADAEEGWTAPLDARMAALGATVSRRNRADVVDDQDMRDAAALKAEYNELKVEYDRADAKARTEMRQQMDDLKSRINTQWDAFNTRVEQVEVEARAKLAAMDTQYSQVSAAYKAKLEQRMNDVKANLDARMAKLKQAGGLLKDALG